MGWGPVQPSGCRNYEQGRRALLTREVHRESRIRYAVATTNNAVMWYDFNLFRVYIHRLLPTFTLIALITAGKFKKIIHFINFDKFPQTTVISHYLDSV